MSFSLSFNLSTAHVKTAILAKVVADANAENPKFEMVDSIFHPDDGEFFLLIEMAGVVDAVTVKAKWIAVDAGNSKDHLIDEADYTVDTSTKFYFDLSLPHRWPVGKYKVELYLHDKIERTIEFQVIE
jgi:hypothetical protein